MADSSKRAATTTLMAEDSTCSPGTTKDGNRPRGKLLIITIEIVRSKKKKKKKPPKKLKTEDGA